MHFLFNLLELLQNNSSSENDIKDKLRIASLVNSLKEGFKNKHSVDLSKIKMENLKYFTFVKFKKEDKNNKYKETVNFMKEKNVSDLSKKKQNKKLNKRDRDTIKFDKRNGLYNDGFEKFRKSKSFLN